MMTTKCQLCGSDRLTSVIDLGSHPLADTFLTPQQAASVPAIYPLRVLLCTDCGYATLHEVVPPEKRYVDNDYSYTSSNSRVAVEHFRGFAQQVIDRARVAPSDLVVDIGSNDGTLLDAFRSQSGCRVVGIEPAPNIARLAFNRNIPTLNRFFDSAAVKEIVQGGKAKVIIATNVFNHITDLPEFMDNVCALLADDGVFVFEVPYLSRLVQDRAFDTIYLEHVSYFALKPLAPFFKRFQLNIVHAETNDYMGGSIRVYAGRQPENTELLKTYIAAEEKQKIFDSRTYQDFMRDVLHMKERVVREIAEVKAAGQRIIGIGAATKGNTFLNFCGIDTSMLDFVTDASPLKIGKVTPGSGISIRSDDDITPDITHALILPWNIADFLIEKLKHRNLKFIVPRLKT